MRLTLIVQSGPRAGTEIDIPHLPFYIGRGPDCHLRPTSPTISKRHAALLFRQGQLYLSDLGSTHGTIVNGQRLQNGELALHDGSLIEFGVLKLLIRVARTPPPAPAEHQPANAGEPGAAAPTAPTKEESSLGHGDTVTDRAPVSPANPTGSPEPPNEPAAPPSAKAQKAETSRIAGELLRRYRRRIKEEGSS
jgi:predicted component of type VI protein secretion system